MSATRPAAEPAPSDIPKLPVDAVLARLRSSPQGLTSAEAKKRLKTHGPNRLERAAKRPLWVRFLANFTHLMAILLWVGGAVGFLAGMPPLGVAIWMVNVINGAFSFWMEFRAEKAAEALRRLLPVQAVVVRDRAERRVPAERLVPGDLIVLSEGERVSADARIVEEEGLRADQSTLTGESKPADKTAAPDDKTGLEADNVVFAGTTISSGQGKAVVVATGMDTAFGAVVRSTQTVRDEPSPLQKELARVTRVISVAAVVVGASFFLLAWTFAGVNLAESFIFAMGIIVAFVPEGLLPTVTLALAMGVRRMAKRGALIKRLASVETLGAASVICTDKTGTLTENQMTVTDVWLPGRRLRVTGTGYSPEGKIQEDGRPVALGEGGKEGREELSGAGGRSGLGTGLGTDQGEGGGSPGRAPDAAGRRAGETGSGAHGDPEGGLRLAMRTAALCHDVHAVADGTGSPRSAARSTSPPRNRRHKRSPAADAQGLAGDPTELALYALARKAGLDPTEEAAASPRVREYSFDADLKRMTSVHRSSRSDGGLLAFSKGATAEIVARCARVMRDGREAPMDDRLRAEIDAAADDYARQGLRVLALAWRRLPPGQVPGEDERDAVETDLTFLGLTAMLDPPRPGVLEAMEKCRAAGVRVIMITGDHALTAENIARRLGVVKGEKPLVVASREFMEMDGPALKEALAEPEIIFARAAPESKLRIVQSLQEMGHVVAVTGDGVNDAPALKKADIGVAMGVSGTDAAREASDMILADDHFASIVDAIEEGRAVYGNIRKFIVYIFTSNGAEAVPFILFALSKGRIPLALGVMHVLLIDLGSDMLPALGLGAEPPEPGVMERSPRGPRDRLITPALLGRSFLLLGLLEGGAAMAAFYWRFWTNGFEGKWLDLPSQGPLYASATALAYGAVVFTQMGNVLAQRTERRSLLSIDNFRNGLIWAGVGLEAIFVAALAYVPAINYVVGAAPFAPSDWLFLLALIPLPIIVEEVRKAWLRRGEATPRRSAPTRAS